MTPQEESFTEFLDRVIGPLPAGEVDPSTPDAPVRGLQDDAQADHVLRQLKHLQADDDADIRFADRAHANLVAWYTIRQRPRLHRKAWLESLLYAYYEHLKEGGKVYRPKRRQSHTPYVLPEGTLEAYAIRAEYEVIPGQEDAFTAWCEDHDLVQVVIKPRWGEAKQRFHATEDGYAAVEVEPGTQQVLPFIRVTREAGEGFRIKLSGDLQAATPEEDHA